MRCAGRNFQFIIALCFTQQNYLRVYVFVLCEEECYVSFAGSDAILSLRLFTRVPFHALAASSNLRSSNLSLLFHTSKAGSEVSVLGVTNDSFYEEWFAQPVFRLVYETTYAEHQLVWGVLWEIDSDE